MHNRDFSLVIFSFFNTTKRLKDNAFWTVRHIVDGISIGNNFSETPPGGSREPVVERLRPPIDFRLFRLICREKFRRHLSPAAEWDQNQSSEPLYYCGGDLQNKANLWTRRLLYSDSYIAFRIKNIIWNAYHMAVYRRRLPPSPNRTSIIVLQTPSGGWGRVW